MFPHKFSKMYMQITNIYGYFIKYQHENVADSLNECDPF
jgi:hypothetical protein